MLKSNGYEKINLDLGKARRIKETRFQIEKVETLFLFQSSKPSQAYSKNMKN